MYGLRLESSRCPDGFVVEDDGKVFRPRTAKRHRIRLETVDLTNPYALQFINATANKEIAAFLSQYGPLDPAAEGHKVRDLVQDQTTMAHLLELAASGDAMKYVEYLMKRGRLGFAVPKPFHDRGMVFFQFDSLRAFMHGEIGVVYERDTRFVRCAQCNLAILTGETTGRKGHVQYCSTKCRMQAMRARKGE